MTLKTGLGVLKIIENVFLLMFYSNYMPLFRVVSGIFKGQSKSMKVVAFDRLCMVSC